MDRKLIEERKESAKIQRHKGWQEEREKEGFERGKPRNGYLEWGLVRGSEGDQERDREFGGGVGPP